MYAIFEDGSRQYMVEEGESVQLDFRDAEPSSRLEFDQVLLFHTGEDARIGQPTVAGAKVVAEVLDQTSKKTYIQKFRRRKNYRRFRGHRQPFLEVEILELFLEGWERPQVEDEEPDDEMDQAEDEEETNDEDEAEDQEEEEE